jgi:hypothetical protein
MGEKRRLDVPDRLLGRDGIRGEQMNLFHLSAGAGHNAGRENPVQSR